MTGSHGEHLNPVWTSLKSSNYARTDPDRIERLNFKDLVIEFEPARAAENDVDLLCLLVLVGERLALARNQPMETNSCLGSIKVILGKPCFHIGAKSKFGCGILDID